MGNKTEFLQSATLTEEAFQENPIINWDAITWVDRPPELWAVQLFLAIISLTEALLIAYLGYKVNLFELFCWKHFLTEVHCHISGKYMATNPFISLHIRTCNHNTIYSYGKPIFSIIL